MKNSEYIVLHAFVHSLFQLDGSINKIDINIGTSSNGAYWALLSNAFHCIACFIGHLVRIFDAIQINIFERAVFPLQIFPFVLQSNPNYRALNKKSLFRNTFQLLIDQLCCMKRTPQHSYMLQLIIIIN